MPSMISSSAALLSRSMPGKVPPLPYVINRVFFLLAFFRERLLNASRSALAIISVSVVFDSSAAFLAWRTS